MKYLPAWDFVHLETLEIYIIPYLNTHKRTSKICILTYRFSIVLPIFTYKRENKF